jgi:hypothetical protein
MELSITNNLAEFDEEYQEFFNDEKTKLEIYLERSDILKRRIKILPISLIYIEIRCGFNHPIDFTYLDNLKCLQIINEDFDQSIDKLPDSVQEIVLGRSFNQPVNKWPANLKYLHFLRDPKFNQSLDNLPYGIKEINIESTGGNSKFNQPVDNLPDTLKLLNLGGGFNQPVDNLPESLEQLGFGWYYFEEYNIDSSFNQPIDNLPKKLKVLTLGDSFFQPINNLPNGLKELFITNPDYDIPIIKLPKKLKIYITSSNSIARINGEDENMEPSYLEQFNFKDYGIKVIIDTEIEDSLIEFTESDFNYYK